MHLVWRVHRFLHQITGGRFLWTPAHKCGWGAMQLTTLGRRSGEEGSVIVGYLEDGPNPVVVAMNGWDESHPAWWLNLEVASDAVVHLAGRQPCAVRARRADGDEHERLWQRWLAVEPDRVGYAGHRSTETPVILFEPAGRPGDRASPCRT